MKKMKKRQDVEDDADNVEWGVKGENQTDDNAIENIEQRGSGLRHDLELIRGGCLYVHKNGLCCSVHKLGEGLYLSPRSPVVLGAGDWLYVKTGSTVYNGHGLLIGPNNICKKNPILKVLL